MCSRDTLKSIEALGQNPILPISYLSVILVYSTGVSKKLLLKEMAEFSSSSLILL